MRRSQQQGSGGRLSRGVAAGSETYSGAGALRQEEAGRRVASCRISRTRWRRRINSPVNSSSSSSSREEEVIAMEVEEQNGEEKKREATATIYMRGHMTIARWGRWALTMFARQEESKSLSQLNGWLRRQYG